MLKSGLVSVTFREFSPEKIVEICRKADLNAIEWGGDVHVPPNDFSNAEKVSELTRAAGLEVSAYGSYLRLGRSENFEDTLQIAEILQTKLIRVWAGEIGSSIAEDTYRTQIIEESKRIADQAGEKDISIVYEFHANTLTDSSESCVDLLKKVGRENLKTYWQPKIGNNLKSNLRDIELLRSFIAGVHVFQWCGETRNLLSSGESEWRLYFDLLNDINGFAMIEFVKDDSIKNFAEDAVTLKRLVSETKEQ